MTNSTYIFDEILFKRQLQKDSKYDQILTGAINTIIYLMKDVWNGIIK